MVSVINRQKGKAAARQSPNQSPVLDAADAVQELLSQLILSSSRSGQPALKRACLERDQYCCVATGLLDLQSGEDFPDLVGPDTVTTFTECAHILPFALGDFNPNDGRQVRLFLKNLQKQ